MDLLNVTGFHRRAPHLVAQEKGFFAQEGLEVRFHLATFAPDHNQGMAEGRWDMSLGSADNMISRATTHGVDFLLFFQAEEGLTAKLISRTGITSIEQLKGKLLAGDPGDSNLDLIRRKILRSHGMGEEQYQVEIIGSSPKRLEAFLQDRVAAAMLTPPCTDRALAAGGVLLANAEDYVPDWPLTCGWALRGWLESHREIVVRFIRAWVAATDWLLESEHREETLGLLMRFEQLTREAAARAYGNVVPKARINPRALYALLELRKEMGVYQPPHYPPEHFYDCSYWCEATGLPAPISEK